MIIVRRELYVTGQVAFDNTGCLFSRVRECDTFLAQKAYCVSTCSDSCPETANKRGAIFLVLVVMSVSGRVITPLFKDRERLLQNEGFDFVSQVLLASFGFRVINNEFK